MVLKVLPMAGVNDLKKEGQQFGEERESLGGTIREFLSDTSGHGFPNVERSRHPARKIFWTVVVLAGCGVTTWQVVDLFILFWEFPVTISVNMTSTRSLYFPSVTICNVNPVRKSMLYHVDDHLSNILPISFGGNDTSALRSHAARAALKDNFYSAWSRLNDSQKKLIGHQAEDMMLDCSYDGEKCGPENFTLFTNPAFGNCFVFNSGWNGQKIMTSHKSGEEFGLTLELYIEEKEYIPEITESAGARVSIVPQNMMPFPEDDGVLIAPGQLTFLSLTMVNISRKPSPYPSCCWSLDRAQAAYYSVYAEHYDVKYSLSGCQKSCYQSHVIEQCGCGDPIYPISGQAVKRRLPDPNTNILPCKEENEDCEQEVFQKYVQGLLQCDCGLPCVELNYAPLTSSTRWPNDAFSEIYYSEITHENPHIKELIENRNNPQNATSPRNNLLKLQIFFSDLNYEAVKEVASFPVSDFISNVGGTIGLYLGLSIVALFEIFELFFDLLRVGFGSLCRK